MAIFGFTNPVVGVLSSAWWLGEGSAELGWNALIALALVCIGICIVNVKINTGNKTEREASADVVLMDVPCSGLGVMGKKRDIKYHVTPEGLKSIHELQRQIVEAGWRYVKPGGVLLYSTCTINREENQNMAAWITEKFPFVLEEERQLLPGTDETDGFYFARLRRRT